MKTYNNIQTSPCNNTPLSNPVHNLVESLYIDQSLILHNRDLVFGNANLTIPSRVVRYTLMTDNIPLTHIQSNSGWLDSEWRGKLLLFGEEYYVKRVKNLYKIYIAKGMVFDNVTNESYSNEYQGYKFEVHHLLSCASSIFNGAVLNVKKPDNTVVQVQANSAANGIVDDIEIACVRAEQAGNVATIKLIVYDKTTDVLLEDGKDIEFGDTPQ